MAKKLFTCSQQLYCALSAFYDLKMSVLIFLILNTVALLSKVQGKESRNHDHTFPQDLKRSSNITLSSVKKGSFRKENSIQFDKHVCEDEVKDKFFFRKFVEQNQKEKYFPINILKKGGKLSNIYLSEGPRPNTKTRTLSYIYSSEVGTSTISSIYSCSNFYNSLSEPSEISESLRDATSTECFATNLTERLSTINNDYLKVEESKPIMNNIQNFIKTPIKNSVLKFSEKGLIYNEGSNDTNKPRINASYEFQLIIPHSAVTIGPLNSVNPIPEVSNFSENIISQSTEPSCQLNNTECNAATAYAIS